ncbi:FadR/GntR family transcriptional regulator [Microbacterium pseudoresistens]|uniref:DNA-binding FadR family transcriptional regulator n=1 Tax=Microbacterium pseudoresistens TaxID=640634 RepID=A0A7Y9ESV1_9MICO|nr:FCD domain-containing protein [Microbacterium pseudoresistens]NYD53134.1 DNA-binding FadR family transcriptional regulator [Microbacterium pseudoresistens]
MVDLTSSGSPSAKHRSRVGSGLYAHVFEILGQEIIDGTLPVDSIVFAEQISERFGVSRSVVRESLRSLSSMGLLESRPQVGTRVQPRERWDLLNPHVVYWRSQGLDYRQQMRELLELRLGLEQAAARFASERITPEQAEGLIAAADGMRAAIEESHDLRAFFDADAKFHRLLLEGTANPVIAQLSDTIGATLHARAMDTRPGMHDITETSIETHSALAAAIAAHDGPEAERLAKLLVADTLDEFS